MPHAAVNGINLYYERRGAGEPLLFIGGLGANLLQVPHVVESYSRHFSLIVYDGRGCGRSDKPAGDYSIAGLADDAAALLDALGVASALVYGRSMGGMVAQELALRHPHRTRAVILGCTTAGITPGAIPSPDVIAAMARNGSLTGDAAIEAGWPLGYSAAFIAANRALLMERGRAAQRYDAPPEAHAALVRAAARHNTLDRLGKIACPVMIIHGDQDVMAPVANAHLIKERIPHAELHVLPGMGHGYDLEARDRADALVIDFCRRHATPGTAHALR